MSLKIEIDIRLHDRLGTSKAWITFDDLKTAQKHVQESDAYFSGDFLVDYTVYNKDSGEFLSANSVLRSRFLNMNKKDFLDKSKHKTDFSPKELKKIVSFSKNDKKRNQKNAG